MRRSRSGVKPATVATAAMLAARSALPAKPAATPVPAAHGLRRIA
jgi:hypothetical protein